MNKIRKLPDNIKPLATAFKNDCINVVFSSSDYYAPYLGVALHSLVKNSNPDHNYDIVVFTHDMSEKNTEILRSMTVRKNISLRFYNVDKIFDRNIYIPNCYDGTVTVETYYRILAPLVLKAYSKSLFLDSDMLITGDVADLYSTDVSGYALAACHEILLEASHIEAKFYELQRTGELKDIRRKSVSLGKASALKHVQKLGLKRIEHYFQAGMILYNNKYFNDNHYVQQLFENIQKKNYVIVDQDALNELCKGHVKLLDHKWNYTPKEQGNFYMHMTAKNQTIMDAVRTPEIIHFVGSKMKPWDFCTGYYHSLWWQYARETPLYETVIARNCIKQSVEKIQLTAPDEARIQTLRQVYDIKNLWRTELKYLRYSILKCISFGKTRKHYKKKKSDTKAKIKEIKHIKRSIGI